MNELTEFDIAVPLDERDLFAPLNEQDLAAVLDEIELAGTSGCSPRNFYRVARAVFASM